MPYIALMPMFERIVLLFLRFCLGLQEQKVYSVVPHDAQKNPRGKRKVIRFPGLHNRSSKIPDRYNQTNGDIMIHTTVQSQSSSWTLL